MPVIGSDEKKRTNEIGMAIPLLDGCEIAVKVVTADALLTQRALAEYLIGRQAHSPFTVKGNQPRLERAIAWLFAPRGAPDFITVAPPTHGRIETRRIWCRTALNASLDFPRQVLAVNRGHWTIESTHYLIDWNYDEDRSRIRVGFGPENITRLRRRA